MIKSSRTRRNPKWSRASSMMRQLICKSDSEGDSFHGRDTQGTLTHHRRTIQPTDSRPGRAQSHAALLIIHRAWRRRRTKRTGVHTEKDAVTNGCNWNALDPWKTAPRCFYLLFIRSSFNYPHKGSVFLPLNRLFEKSLLMKLTVIVIPAHTYEWD